MHTWRVTPGGRIEGLQKGEAGRPALGPLEVRVRLKCASLNYRDLMIANGWYPVSTQAPLVPGSDGAGEVIETGAAVTRFKTGDRVATSFFPNWVEGRVTGPKLAGALGAGGVGTLGQELVLPELGLVRSPAHLDFAQAATLTCAGVTAWNALFVAGRIRPGETVLLLGTGGVSIWALQLAKAAGARVIITSSSDEKLAKAKTLGADETINYVTSPEWGAEAKRLTGGEGADLVLEVGGEKTIPQTLAAARLGGTVIIIGGVSGFGGAVNPRALIGGVLRMQGVFVGSRRMHENLARFVEQQRLQPVVDRRFAFDQAPEAYRHFEAGKHFGKVAIELG